MVCIMNDLERIKLLKEKIYKFKEISKLSNSDLSYLIGFGANRIDKIINNSGDEGNIEPVEKQMNIVLDYSQETIKLFKDNIHKIQTDLGRKRVEKIIKEIEVNLELQNTYEKLSDNLIKECNNLINYIEKLTRSEEKIDESELLQKESDLKLDEKKKELEEIRKKYKLNNVADDFEAVANNYGLSILNICKLVGVSNSTYYRNREKENKLKRDKCIGNDNYNILNDKDKLYKAKIIRTSKDNMKTLLKYNKELKKSVIKKVKGKIDTHEITNLNIQENLYSIFEKISETNIKVLEVNKYFSDK